MTTQLTEVLSESTYEPTKSYGTPSGIDNEFLVSKELPDSFIVWRGIEEAEFYAWDGLSWTTNRDLALWHAYNKCKDGGSITLLCARVKKESVIARYDFNTNFIINPAFEKHRENEYMWYDLEDEENDNSIENLEAYMASRMKELELKIMWES